MDISERDLLSAIGKVLSGAGHPVRVGVGDDAAVIAAGSGEQVLTTDVLVEGSHFLTAITRPRDLGRKAIAVSVSDIAAMAASPRAALCALTLTDRVDAAWAMELFGGMREVCDEHALWLVGGDLAAGTEVSIAITVVGEVAPGRAVLRSGARAGDRIVVTGTLGGAAAGRRIAEGGSVRPPTQAEIAAIGRFERPVARVGEGAILAATGATSMIDLSDGLALDLTRIGEASGVGARILAEMIPVHEAATLGDALYGGEDYELLATLPPEDVAPADREIRATFGVSLTSIGTVKQESGVILVDESGFERTVEPMGWDHFEPGAPETRA